MKDIPTLTLDCRVECSSVMRDAGRLEAGLSRFRLRSQVVDVSARLCANTERNRLYCSSPEVLVTRMMHAYGY